MLRYSCESLRAQPAFAEDWTKQWGSHPHTPLLTDPRARSISDPFMHTCPTSLGLLFWEGPLDSHDFPNLRVDPSPQTSRHSQDLSCYAARWCCTASLSSSLCHLYSSTGWKKTQPFYHTSTSFVTQAIKRCSRYCALDHGIHQRLSDLDEFKLWFFSSSKNIVSCLFGNRRRGRTQTGMITSVILRAKLWVVR